MALAVSGKGDAAWILFMTANLELVAKVGRVFGVLYVAKMAER